MTACTCLDVTVHGHDRYCRHDINRCAALYGPQNVQDAPDSVRQPQTRQTTPAAVSVDLDAAQRHRRAVALWQLPR